MPGLATLLCFVIGVTDGDTLTTRSGDQQLTIRLAEIDAPEAKQPFGRESRMNLRALCFQKEAVVRPQSSDRYGRTGQLRRPRCQQRPGCAGARLGLYALPAGSGDQAPGAGGA